MPRPILALLAVVTVLAFTGCQSLQNYRHERESHKLCRCFNRFSANLPVGDVHIAHDAVLAAFKDLQLEPVTDQVDALTSQVTAFFADNVELTVTIRKRKGAGCRMVITCGLLGDRTRAELVYRAIVKHLPK